MSLTFLSKSLNRTVTFADLDSLSAADARSLLGELHVALASMDASLANAKAAGSPDPDWVHGITKKSRICAAFHAQVTQLVERSAPAPGGPTAYQQLFQALMHAEFKRELGSVYDQIVQDAHEAAVCKLQDPTAVAALAGTPVA